jgi:CubicO group peptidase (beta-lactamase class C family)
MTLTGGIRERLFMGVTKPVRTGLDTLWKRSHAGLLPLALAAIIAGVPGCDAYRMIRHNYAGIEDYRIFSSRTIPATPEAFRFQEATAAVRDSALAILASSQVAPWNGHISDSLRARGVVAFLILHGDTLIHEKYFDGYGETSIVPSFSVAKSFVSALVGIAIAEGKIRGIDQPVTDFIPELASNGFGKVTIRHLLTMTSGIDFSESYRNPLSGAAAFYYSSDLRKRIVRLKLASEPGTVFSYRSVDPQVLGMVLERATGMPLSRYLEEKLWAPLGMEYDATWSLDREGGTEKAFCCLNARARDFAKFGLLYLNRGLWNGRVIVPETWVEASLTPVTTPKSRERYGYLWWLDRPEDGGFWAEGILGQFIYVHPPTRTVLVTLSSRRWLPDGRFMSRLCRALR